MAGAAKSSQDILDEFWKSSISTANLTKGAMKLLDSISIC